MESWELMYCKSEGLRCFVWSLVDWMQPSDCCWSMKCLFGVLMIYMEVDVNMRKPRAAMPTIYMISFDLLCCISEASQHA
jgi:hypothetical protein